MNALIAVAVLTLSAGGKPPEQQRVENLVPFDVASCFTPKASVPSNAEGVSGALRLLRPSAIECLVDAKARGGGEATVGLTFTDGGVTASGVEGPGKACIEKAAAQLTWPASAPKANSDVRVGGPSVKTGVNAASDIAAAIRLAQGQWCDCYAEKLPASIELDVHVKAGAGVEVTPVAASTVASCLAAKVKTLKLEAPTETHVPYVFFFIDSRADAESADAPPALQFAQLDAIRARRSAESAMAVGARVAAVTTYDGLVAKYNAAKKPYKMVKEISARCADLVKADDALVAAVAAQSALDVHTAELTEGFAAKDPQWKNAAAAMRAQAQAGAGEADKMKAARDSDAKVCPK
jgi:hypothetical protein